MSAKPVWTEIHADDPAKAKAFYADLFGWDLQDQPMGDTAYTMVQFETGPGVGIIKNQAPKPGSHWLVYVEVDDVDTATDKARSLGAQVVREPVDVGIGQMSIVIDPSGAPLGLWKSAPQG